MWRFILTIFLIWRLNLEFLAWLGQKILPVQEGFLGPSPWANFDGVHYLFIAKRGYAQFEQAFFPFYPLLIRWLGNILRGDFVLAGIVISNLSLLGVLILVWKVLEIKPLSPIRHISHMENFRKWTVAFLLLFPTSFYFGSVYTESLFLFLVLASFYILQKKKWWFYALTASLASATRLVGAFLLAPFGLFAYMIYLGKTFADPLFFLHAQPFFGAGRTGGEIILLPQVYWRYLKIFVNVPRANYDYWIAALEFLVFNGTLFLLWLGWKKGLPRAWILFSAAAVLGPTLTGSLSSMPRYILAAFPIFIVMASLNNKLKYLLFVLCYLLFSLLTILFTRGYWVS